MSTSSVKLVLDDHAMNVGGVMAYTGLSRNTIYRAMDAGHLRFYRPAGLNRKRMFYKSDVDAFLRRTPAE
jgi:excisionase family DNA binding protein